MLASAERLKVLSHEQARRFVADGWVVVEEAFPRELAGRVSPLLWRHLDGKPDDPLSWRQDGVLIRATISEEPALQVLTTRYRDAVDDLCGEGRGILSPYLGDAPIRFPGFALPPWRATGWHVDGKHFHHHVDSPEIGLAGLDLFSDIEPDGGGTAVRVGSHRVVSRLLAASEPSGLSYRELNSLAEEATRDLPVLEVRGRAGDVILMHPHLVHGSSTNLSRTVRLAANRSIPLKEPLRPLRRAAEDCSLVELAVRQAVRN